MNVDVIRHDCLRLLIREHHSQRQQQQNDEEEEEDHHDRRAPSFQVSPGRLSIDLGRRAVSDIHSKCACHDACQERAQVLTREIEKLREALDALRRESDKEIAYLKDQLLATATSATIASKSPSRIVSAPNGCSVASFPLRTTSHASTMTTTSITLAPTFVSVKTSGSPASTYPLHRLAVDKSSKNALSLTASMRLSPYKSTVRDPLGVAQRVLAAFQSQSLGISSSEQNLQPNAAYFYSLTFCDDMGELASHAGACFQLEPRCHTLSSPVYVFGDLHGNLQDLSFFAGRIWQPLGIDFSAGSLLFLGDYVDRGAMSLEVVAYLFALKLLSPSKVFLLRGNHETRAVNGLEEVYGSACLLAQCQARFGEQRGRKLWNQVNSAFDRLPLAATIDNDVFCVHGGIPRPVSTSCVSPIAAKIADIQRLPPVAPLDLRPAVSEPKHAPSPTLKQQLAMVSEMLWADPARNLIAAGSEDDDVSDEGVAGLDGLGFGQSARGGAAITFGPRAVANFLAANGFSRILRAHEAALDGVRLSMGTRVVTLFSTSADHGLGADATCACILVENQQMRVLNRAKPDVQSSHDDLATPFRTDESDLPRQRRRSVTLRYPGGDGRPLLGQERYQQLYEASRPLPVASMVMDRIASRQRAIGYLHSSVVAERGGLLAATEMNRHLGVADEDTDGEDGEEEEQVRSNTLDTENVEAQDNNQADDE